MPDGPGRPERERSGPPALLPARPGSVRIVFLGGLGEIGRNCACIEVEDRIMLPDCGLMFPDTEMPGIDLVLPDFTCPRETAGRAGAGTAPHGPRPPSGR